MADQPDCQAAEAGYTGPQMPSELLDAPPQAVAWPAHSTQARLNFLDGLRGLAALYVVCHHSYLEQPATGHHRSLALGSIFEFGRLAVDIFIVLSGFCLMIPVAKSPEKKLAGIAAFFRRRTWRILPPYYAAVGLSLLLIRAIPGMDHRSGAHWDISLPAWTVGAVVSHLFLIHNLSPAWVYKINHALWSVATEFQIYLLFPLILLPLWRKCGSIALLAICLAGGIGCCYVFPSLNGARPWYVCLFVLGMVGAEITFSQDSQSAGLRERAPWGVLTFLLILGSASTALFHTALKRHQWVPDVAVGLFSMTLLLYCAAGKRHQPRVPLTLRLLESPAAVWLGVISYSLYLIHPPIIAAVNIFLERYPLSEGHHLLAMMSVGVVMSVLGGWLFHLGIERWFIPAADPRRRSDGVAATISTVEFNSQTTGL